MVRSRAGDAELIPEEAWNERLSQCIHYDITNTVQHLTVAWINLYNAKLSQKDIVLEIYTKLVLGHLQ